MSDGGKKEGIQGRVNITPDPSAGLQLQARAFTAEHFNVIAWQFLLSKLVEKGVLTSNDAVEMCAKLSEHLRAGPGTALYPKVVDEVCNFLEDVAGDYLKR